MKAPWKSFVFDGVKRDESDFAWKYDDKNASYSNEFYQINEFPAPFVGILFYRSDDVDIFGTWFVKGYVINPNFLFFEVIFTSSF